MKLLHIADLHLGRFLDGRPRWDEQEAVLDEIVAIARREEVDLVLAAGDVFDSFIPPARAEELFYDFAARLLDCGCVFIAIAGNHDQPQRMAAAAPLAQRQGLYLLGLPGEEPVTVTCRDGRKAVVAALPYVSEARAQELFSADLSDEEGTSLAYRDCLAQKLRALSAAFSEDTANIVLAHLFVNGGFSSDSERPLSAQVGGSFGVDAAVFPEDCDYIALGHLHRPQSISAACPCRYAGSPLAYSFSEADQQKSVTLVEISWQEGEKEVSWQVLPLNSGRPLSRWHCDSYADAMDRASDPAQREMWVQLTVELTRPMSGEELDALYAAHPYLIAVNPIYPDIQREQRQAEESASLTVLERFAAFARDNEGVEPDEELLSAFTSLLQDREGDDEL